MEKNKQAKTKTKTKQHQQYKNKKKDLTRPDPNILISISNAPDRRMKRMDEMRWDGMGYRCSGLPVLEEALGVDERKGEKGR